MSKVAKGLEKALEFRGVKYGYWTWERNFVLWADAIPTLARAREIGGVCSSVPNVYRLINGMATPAPPGKLQGGTGAWFAAHAHHRLTDLNRSYPAGTLFMSDYLGQATHLQGHVAIAGESGVNPWLIQSDTGLGWNDQRRLKDTQQFARFTHYALPDQWLGKESSSVHTPSVPVTWYPASEKNYTVGRGRAIDRVVLHVTGGSFNSAVNTFQNPANQVSAHYLIRSSDGHVGQLVSELNTAWHAGSWDTNQRSIGVEHEAVKGQPAYLTSAMLNSSARLVADICEFYNISPDSQHIIFHREVKNTECPTPFWDKGRYIQLVRKKMTPTPAPTPPTDPNDSLFGPVRFSLSQAIAATQAIYPDANMARCQAAARAIYATTHPGFVRPDFRYAQFLWETRHGLYGGDSVWPNFAGIKKGPVERGGDVGDEPIDFLKPRNAMLGAHIQALHMIAYTKTPLPKNPDPIHERFWVAKKARAKQPAVTRISQLGNGAWATDPDYAKHLSTLMDRLAAHSTVKEIDVQESKHTIPDDVVQRQKEILESDSQRESTSESQNQPVEADSPSPSKGSLEEEKPSLPKREPVMTTASIGSVIFGLVYLAFGADTAGQVPIEALDQVGLWLSIIAPLVVGAISRRFVYSPATIERAGK